ncbi:MAG: hypothetical protein WEE89_00955 [Gemmatimonadota bacterium]
MEDSGSLAKFLWPTLLEIARPAREKRRLEPETRDRLILDLCGRASLSVRELSQLLDRTEAYVGDAIRPLVDAQLLTFQYPDQPRHPRQRYLTRGSDADTAVALPSGTSQAVRRSDVLARETSKENPASLVWDELERIARPARDKRRLSPAILDDLVVALCGRAPLSVRELATLLNRSEAYVSDAIQPLIARGRLSFLYPDQPRHPKQRYAARWTEAPAVNLGVAPVEKTEDLRFQPPAQAESNGIEDADFESVDAKPEPDVELEPVPVYEPPMSPRQSPVAVTIQPPAAARPPAEPAREPEVAPSLLSARTNWILAAIVGVVLGITQPAAWPVFAVVAAGAIAVLHVTTDSMQYQRYRILDSTRGGPTKFIILKTLFALAEIVVLYFLSAAIL